MDSRYDFISLFGEVNPVLEKKLIKSRLHSNIKDVFDIRFSTQNSLQENLDHTQIYFLKNRFNKKLLTQKEISEYVVIPSFSNPRWIVNNSKNTILNHGLIIKPSSYFSKLVWSIAVFLSYFGFFNLIFPDRFIVSKNALEKNIFETKSDDFEIEIIYTGAPGKFQKFTCKVKNKKNDSLSFLKIGMKGHSVKRINNETNALELINQHSFQRFSAPKVDLFLRTRDWSGILQGNIVDHEDKYNENITLADLECITEVYTTVGYKKITIEDYLVASPFPCTAKTSQNISSKTIYLGYSHGDFIPWNRFIGAQKIKIVDWEISKYRPLFYDLFTFIMVVNITEGKKTKQTVLECIEQGILLLNMQGKKISISQSSIPVYLLLAASELLQHYKDSSENFSNNKIVQGINNIIITIVANYFEQTKELG